MPRCTHPRLHYTDPTRDCPDCYGTGERVDTWNDRSSPDDDPEDRRRVARALAGGRTLGDILRR